MRPPVFCWDIDGTLLTTARAGVYALEHATRAVAGTELDLQSLPTAGMTDVEIARLILSKGREGDGPDRVALFLRLYEENLPSALHRRQGRVMPGVLPILEFIRERPEWESILLTGNTLNGAAAKLKHYGLAEFFIEGAFSNGTSNRAQIAWKALELVRSRHPGVSARDPLVIGDTPHDITCARAIGARCLAVATGGYSVEALRDADAVVAELSVEVMKSTLDQLGWETAPRFD